MSARGAHLNVGLRGGALIRGGRSLNILKEQQEIYMIRIKLYTYLKKLTKTYIATEEFDKVLLL